jgi:FkbM family methyltransferase
MQYYSQCGEDKYLYERFFKDYPKGVYFEAGALDGVKYSNTLFFEETLGWRGILVEPNPTQFAALQKRRCPRNIYLNTVISDSPDPVEFIYSDDVHAAVSGISATIPESHQTDYYQYIHTKRTLLQPQTLTQILKEAAIPMIDLFILDVEGHEMNVLRSFSWEIPIRVMMIENLDPSNREIHDLIISKGYLYDGAFQHNEIYLHRAFYE